MWDWLRLRLLTLLQRDKAEDATSNTAERTSDDESESKKIRELNAFYYEVASMKLNSQLNEIKTIDTRSTSYFTIGSAVLPIVAGFLSSGGSPIATSDVARYALFVGFGFYLGLAFFYVWSFLYTGWDSRPEVEQWRKVTAEFVAEDLQRWLGDACVEAYMANEPKIEQKAGKSAWALWCLAGEVVFLSIAVLAPLVPW